MQIRIKIGLRRVALVGALMLTGCANVMSQYMREHPHHQVREMSLPMRNNSPLVQMFEKSAHSKTHHSGKQRQAAPNKSGTIMPHLKRDLHGLMDQHLRFVQDSGKTLNVEHDSAVYPLSNGIEAFAARSALVKHAKYSLDLQYYTLQNGLSTRLLMRDIVAAEDRGVRVRILLDDREQLGRDQEMLILNAHPNIEVRLFNPVKRFRSNMITRSLMFMANLNELRRRMHIKMWLADGVLGITGGRNLGDRYFNASAEDNFTDVDALLGGAVLMQMQTGFDTYWNSQQVVSVDAFESNKIEMRREQISKMIKSTNQLTQTERVQHHPYLRALAQAEKTMLPEALAHAVWGKVDFVMDLPTKITQMDQETVIQLPSKHDNHRPTVVFDRLVNAMAQAKKEVMIVNPYFLPGDALTALLVGLQRKGVKVSLMTNSLESNDVPVVQGHYDAYRDRLLEAGVSIHELRGHPDAPAQPVWRNPIFSIHGSRTALHSKVVLIDRKISFIGSMNFDPCSILANTEVGVMLHNEALAAQLRQQIQVQMQGKYSYELQINERGQTIWRSEAESNTDETGQMRNSGPVQLEVEPGNIWRHLQKRLGSWLPEHYF